MITNRISRGPYSAEVTTQPVRNFTGSGGDGIPGARININGPNTNANFEVSLDFLAVLAREFCDVCEMPKQAAEMPRPVPSPPALVTPVDHATWIDRAMFVHKALRERNLEWTTEGIPKVATLKPDKTHEITAAVQDFGMASFWSISYGSTIVAHSEASFDMALVAASEEVIKVFDIQAEGAKATLSE